MMPDTSALQKDVTAPAYGAFAVTKSDSTTFDGVGANETPPRSLYVGGTGDVVVTMFSGDVVTFSAVPAGTILPVCVKQVRTATTATNIIGLQ
jgi:hypothetical protein